MTNDKIKNILYNEISALSERIRTLDDLKKNTKINFADDKHYSYLVGQRDALKNMLSLLKD